jgi:hypothetical protein
VEESNIEEKKSKKRYFLVPGFIREYVAIWRREGFKALLKKKGWRVVALIIVYYLIRDSILYIFIPYMIAKGLLS